MSPSAIRIVIAKKADFISEEPFNSIDAFCGEKQGRKAKVAKKVQDKMHLSTVAAVASLAEKLGLNLGKNVSFCHHEVVHFYRKL